MALKILIKLQEEKKIGLEVREYLKNIPSVQELSEVYQFLNFSSVKQWMRKSEKCYKDLLIEKIDNTNELLEILAKNPILIERAVVICREDKMAFVARPPEKILDLI